MLSKSIILQKYILASKQSLIIGVSLIARYLYYVILEYRYQITMTKNNQVN